MTALEVTVANHNPRGWISPANLALTPISLRLPQATVDDLDEAAELTGLSKRQTIKKAIAELVQRDQTPKAHLDGRSWE